MEAGEGNADEDVDVGIEEDVSLGAVLAVADFNRARIASMVDIDDDIVLLLVFAPLCNALLAVELLPLLVIGVVLSKLVAGEVGAVVLLLVDEAGTLAVEETNLARFCNMRKRLR